MEISCTRCHQTIVEEKCFCPTCGLPHLVYAPEAVEGGAPAEAWTQPVPDAGSVSWKPAIRMALLMGLPAGLLSSTASPLSLLGLFWMAAAAAWAVLVYMRSQRPAWITIGAGARIGLVTGLFAAWLAFGVSGGKLFVERFAYNHGSQMDDAWKSEVLASQDAAEKVMASFVQVDQATLRAELAEQLPMQLSAGGHAGNIAVRLATYSLFLLVFAMAGGAMGARWMGRMRRPEP
jgi:hypothetical protein